jgi:hypothetical protein
MHRARKGLLMNGQYQDGILITIQNFFIEHLFRLQIQPLYTSKLSRRVPSVSPLTSSSFTRDSVF